MSITYHRPIKYCTILYIQAERTCCVHTVHQQFLVPPTMPSTILLSPLSTKYLQSFVQEIALDDLHRSIESAVDALLVPLREDIIPAGIRNALCDCLQHLSGMHLIYIHTYIICCMYIMYMCILVYIHYMLHVY